MLQCPFGPYSTQVREYVEQGAVDIEKHCAPDPHTRSVAYRQRVHPLGASGLDPNLPTTRWMVVGQLKLNACALPGSLALAGLQFDRPKSRERQRRHP